VYISELKLHGFKSFAKKEVMRLGQGVTTVVGPNGCGKTNIVDAIRWVLGEQKYSILRSGKMEDVIFNGAENVKPLGVCEVALTVHNNRGKLPLEYNDIEIARRVYRSGESEYFLNRTPCRLKDINDLFVDTGMGADAYSVIELKMIEQILSETGDDRRRMFEEAAGINKYRHQRKRTLRRFEANRVDLERINDIIAEVEQKVRNLELQLKRFKRHEALTKNLEESDLSLAYLQIFRYRSAIIPLEKNIKKFKHLRESKSEESSIHEKELDQFRETYRDQDSELKEMQIKMTGLNENREEIRNQILVWTEQGRGALLTIDRLNRETHSNRKKIGDLSQLSLDFDKEISDLEPNINSLLETYKKEKLFFEELESSYRKSLDKLDKAQDAKWELQRKHTDDRTLYDRTQALIEEKSGSLMQLQKSLELTKRDKTLQGKELEKFDRERESINGRFISASDNLKTYEKEMQIAIDERETILDKKQSIKGQLHILKGQLEFYSELIETKEGFPDGTRYILENPNDFPDVLGTIADMFQIEPEFRDALEAGLGDLSHCLISKDKISALSTLNKARAIQAGDLSIVPLKEASGLKVKLRTLPNDKNIIGRGSDMVTTSKQVKPLAEYLLGNLIIVKSLELAMTNQKLADWGIVDHGGAYSGSDLVLKNRQTSSHGNILGRQNKLESIISEIEKYNKDAEIESSSLIDNANKIESTKEKIKDLSQDKEKLNQTLIDIDSNSMRSRIQEEQLLENINNISNEIKDIKLLLKESKKALNSLKPMINQAEKDFTASNQNVSFANENMVKARNAKDEYQQKLQDARIRLVQLESRRDQVKFKKSSGDETVKELRARQVIISKEIDELQQKKSHLDFEVESGDVDLKGLNAEIQKQRSLIDLKQSAYHDTYQSIEEVLAKIAAEQKNREQILEDLKNAELEVADSNQLIRLVEERIWDRYSKKVDDNLVINESEDELEMKINKIQRSLENIGPVNMAVKNEYDEEGERLAILNAQRNDLTAAEENLRETIRKIDRVARKRFQETFDLIKSNFEELFHLFFEGGNATLSLIGDPDPLEADIGIVAQPPGKRNTSLRLLSSGEKALTAISLLFSIYQVKPSPYCILDEVDAPLDDVNIRKFTRVLEKFCDETQFIIVTHNKLTMEIADYMYGVTQEKKGLSQLVSVKFD